MSEESEPDAGVDPDWLTVHIPRALHEWLLYRSMTSVPMRRHHRDVLEWVEEYAEAQFPEGGA